jgi:hypothetical protein
VLVVAEHLAEVVPVGVCRRVEAECISGELEVALGVASRVRQAPSERCVGYIPATLLDEARVETHDPTRLVEIDWLAGRIAASRGPVMHGHALLTAAAERADGELAVAMLVEAAIARDQATTDRWALAEVSYREAIELARESDQQTQLVLGPAGLAWLDARRGREPECRAGATEALRLSGQRGLPAVASTAAVLAGCGGSHSTSSAATAPARATTTASAPAATPTATPVVAKTPSVAQPGAGFVTGQPATVAYTVQSSSGATVGTARRALTVLSVEKGALSDFNGIQLDANEKASPPDYVQVRLTNLGPLPLNTDDEDDPAFAINGVDNTGHRAGSRRWPGPVPRTTTTRRSPGG